MDVIAVRWESLALVVGAIALAAWALADATRSARTPPKEGARRFMFEISRPGEQTEVQGFENGALLGRSPQCHIVFHDVTVSKEHARLLVEGARALIEDLQSTNGTLVNDRAIEGPTVLKPGDRIAVGANIIWFLGEATNNRERL